jgi:DNA-directed RNA polymerase subunit RPC12/RpoP
MRYSVGFSSLPSFIMPCPRCGHHMAVKSVEPALIGLGLEDITHACVDCGTELVRTIKRERASALPRGVSLVGALS